MFSHHSPCTCLSLFIGSIVLGDVLEGPLALLGPLEDLAALFGEVGLAAVAGDVLEEDGLEGGLVGLALAGLFTLGLLELDLDLGGLAELFGKDGVGHAAPELERFVGELRFLGREDLGGNVERLDIDNGVLLLDRDSFL